MGEKHWEKEKLLVMSNFSFSHSVFKRLVSKGHQKVSLCGNGLKEFWKLNNSGHELFIFQIFLIAIDWNFKELHHYLSIKS